MAFFYDSKKEEIYVGRIIGTVVGVIIGLIIAWGSWSVLGAEELGVPVIAGKIGSQPVYGISPKWPIVEHFVRFDKTTQRMSLEDQTYTKDLQPAKVKYTFTYRIVPENACELYRAAGTGYEAKLIDPSLDDALKGVFGKWTATEIVANRNAVTNEVEARLREELPQGFFTDISIKLDDITYSDAFEKGIEQKVLAEQEAQKSKNQTAQVEEEGRQKVIKAKAEADAQVAAAEGKAKAMDIEGAAIRRNSQYLDLKKIEVQKSMAESAKSWNTVIMSSGQAQALLNVPSGK